MIKLFTATLILFLFSKLHAGEIIVGVGNENREALKVENGKLAGNKVAVSLYQCAIDSLSDKGDKVTLQSMPQKRMLYLLENGDINIALPLTQTPDRDLIGYFSRPIFKIKYHLYTRKDIDLSSDLTKYNFVTLRGSSTGGLLRGRGIQFEYVSSYLQALSLAKLNRYDGAVIPEIVIKDIPSEELKNLNKILVGFVPVSMYVSKRTEHSKALIEKVNASISNCIEPS